DDALTLYRLGRLLARRGDHAEAAPLFSRSVAIEPWGENAWMKLALSLQALGDDAAALKACREVVRLQPENEEAKRLILQLVLSTQRAPAAIRLSSGQPAGVAFSGGPTPDWMRIGPAGWGAPQTGVAPARP
ncbi:bacterial transcriptional activator domain-containing protein, partial [Brevundimonas sp.]|uniref:bacterial transcriptional activator domain-containing protein n=1 Tax=Brevundimonas sp. TaxID=1871086 RepID=UPI002ED90271